VSPRKSVVETAATRTRIIARSLALAAVDGLEGVTIGRLAADLGMSKAGVIGHFGTKEALQLATVAEAADRFRERVPGRAVAARPGTERLTRAFSEWIDSVTGPHGAGGCLLTSAATEFDGRPGPVRDAVLAALASWSQYVGEELRAAVGAGELPPGTDVEQVAFELDGIVLSARQTVRMHGDEVARLRANRALGRLLGR
jgi:AcrR family transcriptional regulator